MKRLELSYGGGNFDVVMDLKGRNVSAYSGSEDFHQKYGGKQFYTSLSGLSGKGWIPAYPWVQSLPTYRTDVGVPDFGIQLSGTRGEILPPTVLGRHLWAPIDYRAGCIPSNEYPFIIEEGHRVLALQEHEVVGYFSGQVAVVEEVVRLYFIPSPESEVAEMQVTVAKTAGTRFPKLRRALEGRYFNQLIFQRPATERYDQSLNFWTRLGLHTVAGSVYKITGHIARKRYAREELDTVETLQSASPANFVVLTPTCYLQEKSEGNFEAIGLFVVDGVTDDFEISIELPEAILAMQGDFEKILARLREGAENKVRQAAEFRRQQELQRLTQEERDQQFRRLCEEHAELAVTVEDSVAAGNCRPGTESFRERSFPKRDTATVGELTKFLSVPGVRRVLEHKLQPFMVAPTS